MFALRNAIRRPQWTRRCMSTAPQNTYTTQLQFLQEQDRIPCYRVMDTEGNILEGAKDPNVCCILYFYAS